MIPVPPGWVAIPQHQSEPNEWYYIVGWTNGETEYPQPYIATESGVDVWENQFGRDPYVVSTHSEWVKGE